MKLPRFFISQRADLILTGGLGLLIVITIWAFMPGLGGSLIFDDVPNFLPWITLQDINSQQKVLTFIFSGTGAPGRPLSLLTFLIDDQSWSPNIYALKRTNLAIHIINSCLTFWLCLKLIQRMLPNQTATKQGILALLTASIWTLHPLQTSNVSYIIQRMNLLSTMFELTGLLLFIRGRELLNSSPNRALVLCSLAIGLLMPTAILAKENGLLLCLFALLVESFCFEKNQWTYWRLWKALFLWAPLVTFFAYCLIKYRFFTDYDPSRTFNAWERLLTQGPVLADYLNKLLLPRLHGSGLYFDNFPVSRSLTVPSSTLTCWIILSLIMIGAWRMRHRLPLFSFGIFFYFGGHLMESTLLPLELYFEHRNYLPQLGLWLSLAALLSLAKKPWLTKLLLSCGLLLVALLAVMTRNNATLWGNPEMQTAVWYHENPDSLRATISYANLLLEKNELAAANKVLDAGIKSNPNSLVLAISKLYVLCYWQNQPVTFEQLPQLARNTDHEFASIIMLEKMRALTTKEKVNAGKCQPASPDEIARIYQELLKNPHYAKSQIHTRLYEFLAQISESKGKLNDAIYYNEQAFSNSHNPIYPYRQAMLLKSAGLTIQSSEHAARAKQALGIRHKLLYPELESRINALQIELLHTKESETLEK